MYVSIYTSSARHCPTFKPGSLVENQRVFILHIYQHINNIYRALINNNKTLPMAEKIHFYLCFATCIIKKQATHKYNIVNIIIN